MKLAEERGYGGEDQRELARKIASIDKQIRIRLGAKKTVG